MDAQEQLPIADQELLRGQVCAAQRGDREAFGQLIHRFERTVCATARRRLDNQAEIQELCQEVFIQAFRKIGQLQDPLCFGGWLKAITHRMAINRAVRSKPCTPASPERMESQCVVHETPLGAVLARERCAQVRVGLDRLAATDRETLVAFYFQGQSLVEMSREFHSPVGTIKRRLHVARKRLAKELEAMAPA
jgi:RNA polymerase sigma-70 factor (ECF subfamily)